MHISQLDLHTEGDDVKMKSRRKKYIIITITIIIAIIFISSNNVQAISISKAINSAQSFVNGSESSIFNFTSIYNLLDFLYTIMMIVGIGIAMIVGTILGIRIIFGAIDEKADAKKLLEPYLILIAILAFSSVFWRIGMDIVANFI